ncbi:hypothetical protein ACFVW5_02620 [Streptomyces sp. NPDC058232]|uniref:hypothetical protein n=1 Tax=Streptomyces sp. NPDC058232 TaxID=3346393 RepID=UPI0036E4064F
MSTPAGEADVAAAGAWDGGSGLLFPVPPPPPLSLPQPVNTAPAAAAAHSRPITRGPIERSPTAKTLLLFVITCAPEAAVGPDLPVLTKKVIKMPWLDGQKVADIVIEKMGEEQREILLKRLIAARKTVDPYVSAELTS